MRFAIGTLVDKFTRICGGVRAHRNLRVPGEDLEPENCGQCRNDTQMERCIVSACKGSWHWQ